MRSKASSPFRTVRTLLDSEDSPQKTAFAVMFQ